MDHDTLIQELKAIEKMPVVERIQLAKSRRRAQLERYHRWVTPADATHPKSNRERKLKFSNEVKLFEAVTRGRAKELQKLIDKGVDINVKNYEGLTPLHQCCIEGHSEIAEILLKKGAQVNATDNDGWTPLHASATCGHTDIVELLVRHGADLLASNSDEDMPFEITEDEETLNFLEREMVYQGITERMITERKRVTYTIVKNDILTVLREGGNLDKAVTPDGATFLHVAVANFYNDLVKLLLNNGASHTVEDDDGWRPVHVAAYWGNDEALKILVKQYQTDIEVKTKEGETPYDLCEDQDLKTYIRGLVHKRLSLANALTSNYFFDLNFLSIHTMEDRAKETTNKALMHHQNRAIKHRKSSVDELPVLNPLFNPAANERASEGRTSFRGAKKYAPNIKSQTTERIKENTDETEDKDITKSYSISTITNSMLINHTRNVLDTKTNNNHHEGGNSKNTSYKANETHNSEPEDIKLIQTETNSSTNMDDSIMFINKENEYAENKISPIKEQGNLKDSSNEQLSISVINLSHSSEGSSTNTNTPPRNPISHYQNIKEQDLFSSKLPHQTLSSLKRQRLQQRETNSASLKKFSQAYTTDMNENEEIPVCCPFDSGDITYRFKETETILGPSIVKKKGVATLCSFILCIIHYLTTSTMNDSI